MQMLQRAGGLCMPARTRSQVRQSRCHAYPDFRRLMFLPGGAWVFEASDDDSPVYGDSFVMHTTSAHGHPQHSRQMQALVPLKQRQTGVAVRSPRPSTQIIPLSLEDVEVSIVVLPAEESTGIVPFQQMLLEAEAGNSSSYDPSSMSSSSLAIVPKDNTMLGVVMGAAVRRRDDDVQLPMVSCKQWSYCWSACPFVSATGPKHASLCTVGPLTCAMCCAVRT